MQTVGGGEIDGDGYCQLAALGDVVKEGGDACDVDAVDRKRPGLSCSPSGSALLARG